jgi:hypothetical protein
VKFQSFVRQRIATCADYCPICDKKLAFGGIKPVVCDNKGELFSWVGEFMCKECIWRYEELGLGINLENELKSQPYVVDVLVVIFLEFSCE